MKKTNNEIKQHEEQYWHIRKFKILPLVSTIFFGLLAYGNFKLININLIKEVFSCSEEECTKFILSDFINVYPVIMEYVLIKIINGS